MSRFHIGPAAGSVDTTSIKDGTIATADIAAGAVTTAKIAADAIDGTLIADNAVNSEHYTDGSIDQEHHATLAAGALGVPLVLYQSFSGAGTTNVFSSNAPRKFQVVDAWFRLTAAGAASETGKWTDGTNDITDAVDLNVADNTVARVGTIDDAYYEIAASGSLDLVIATGGDGVAYLMVIPVA